MAGQRRPKGPMWNATPDWKRKVLRAMDEQGISRAELSRRVGVSDAAITVLFRPETGQSRLVPDINRVLGMGRPVQSTGETDDELAELIKIWPDLDEAARKTLLDMAGLVARTKG